MSRGPFPEFSKYVGVPYLDLGRDPKGWDCYGLIYFLNRAHLKKNVPSYSMSYVSAEDCDHVSSAILYHCQEWKEIDLARAEPGDTLVIRIGGDPIHCGLVLDAGEMLHCLRGRETVIESFTGIAWSKRIAGVYRWT